MQPTHPLVAISIGAVIALSPVGNAASQTAPSSSLASLNLNKEGHSQGNSTESVNQSANQPDAIAPPQTELVASTHHPQSRRTQERESRTFSQTLVKPEQNTQDHPADAAATPSENAVAVSQASEAQTAQTAQNPEPDQQPGLTPIDPIAPIDLSAPVTPDGTTVPNPNGTGTGIETETPRTPAPEYLNPSPNPLLTPVRPEDVRIEGTQPITLEQAWELAQRNSQTLQAAQFTLERAEAQLREARAANSPTLAATSDFTVSENQQRNSILSTNQSDTNNTLGASLQLNYDLFTSGSRSSRIRAAEGQVRFQELQVETTAEQLRLDVASDYYDLQEATERVRISRAALEQAQRSLQDAQALERAGVGTRFDVLQSQVDVANSQQELTQNISQGQIASRQLVRRLNLGEAVNVVAADPVSVRDRWNLSLEDSIVLAYHNRAELEQQLVQRDISNNQRRAALGALGPQVSLFATYSLSDLLNGNSDSNSLNGNNSNNNFSDTYQFGLQVRLNLIDGGAARAQAAQERANIAIAESQFADARSAVRLEVEQAYLTLQANSENIQTTTLALQQATEALRLARLRFQAGVGTQSDVLRSQTELTTAEVNQLNAILGYNRSLVQLQRAVSNFPDGNLAEAP